MNRFSLRARLVALAVLLVAFAVTAVGAATYVALRNYLYRPARRPPPADRVVPCRDTSSDESRRTTDGVRRRRADREAAAVLVQR